MNPSERGKDNRETREEREAARSDPAGGTQGEAAGGDRDDVPGGAYNVPPGMADEVSEQEALKRPRPQNPER